MAVGPVLRRALLVVGVASLVLMVIGAVRAQAQEGSESAKPGAAATASAPATAAPASTAPDAQASGGSHFAGKVFRQYRTSVLDRALSAIGIFVLIGLAWLMSNNKGKIDWRLVAWGLGLQLIFALLVLNPVASDLFFGPVDRGIKRLL